MSNLTENQDPLSPEEIFGTENYTYIEYNEDDPGYQGHQALLNFVEDTYSHKPQYGSYFLYDANNHTK